jgi:hypothetical protein
MAAYLIWFIMLFSKGVKTVYAIKKCQAAVLGTIGFITYQFFFLLFNR